MSEIEANVIVRCAAYVRKSTEHGLDQKFNSLQAQLESCESYITSQKSKGWVMVPYTYEDGGFTGANMERPGVQKLIDDVKNNKIDVVVVYKHDRLTRSLTDFAKLIEIFEEHNVSFVSVTEHFNTTDPSGRLFLNMLFSFAQYEREIAAERTRDKIAASKKKGLWMGGSVPFGYEAINKELLISEEEADIVKFIFNKFIEAQSVTLVTQELQKEGYLTKKRKTKSGVIGGKLFDKNTVYRILENKTYLGIVEHKGQAYKGQHKAIITQEQWEKVRALIQESPRKKAVNIRAKTPALLKGIISCGGCDSSMTPTHTTKGNKQYHYYKGSKYLKKLCKSCPVGALPTGEIESIITDELRIIFNNPAIITKVWNKVKIRGNPYSEQSVYNVLHNFDEIWKELFVVEKRRIIQQLIASVIVRGDSVEITIMSDGVNEMAGDMINTDVSQNKGITDNESGFKREVKVVGNNIIIKLPVKFKRHYRGRKSIIIPPNGKVYESSYANVYNEALLKGVLRAFKWWKEIESSESMGVEEISQKENINHSYISKTLKITCLDPDIIYAILDGKQPKSLLLADLMNKEIPDDWQEQRKILGFDQREMNAA